MEATRLDFGDVTLVRVPYAEITVPPEVVSMTSADVGGIGWATPHWADGDQVRVAAAVWIIDADGARIVVDPAQAADDILRNGRDAEVHQQAVADALQRAGYPRESIDTVIASHIDGIGMIAWRDGDAWVPFFPNARVVVTRKEHDAIVGDDPYTVSGGDAYRALVTQGVVDAVDDDHAVSRSVRMRWTGAHSPGHAVVEIGDDAAMVGHLALTPLHCAHDQQTGHVDPPLANEHLRELRDGGRTLIGPLWPAPGAARWTGAAMEPVRQ